MAIGFGNIDLPDLYVFDVARATINDQSGKLFNRTHELRRGRNYRFKNKADITIDFDYISEADLKNLQQLLNNGTLDSYLFIDHPGISALMQKPEGTTHELFWSKKCITGNESPAGLVTGTVGVDYAEFTAGEYTNIQNYDSSYFFFQGVGTFYPTILCVFDLTTILANQLSWELFRRITLLYSGMDSTSSYKDHHVQISFWEQVNSRWTLVADSETLGWSWDTGTQALMLKMYGSLAPDRAFEKFYNYINNTTKKLYCKIQTKSMSRNILANSINFVVNGYEVIAMDGSNSFNFRESFTGAGYRGTLNLVEA